MTVLVVGSVALDSVETPFGRADDVLGGSGTFFSSYFRAPLQVMSLNAPSSDVRVVFRKAL